MAKPTTQPAATAAVDSPAPATPSSYVSSAVNTPEAAAQSPDFGGLSPIRPIALFREFQTDQDSTSEEENSLNELATALFSDDEEETSQAPGTPTPAAQASEWHTPERTVAFSMRAHLESLPFPDLELPLAQMSLGSSSSSMSGRSSPACSSTDSSDWS